MEKSKLHRKIMRRVYFVYTLQRIFSPRVMKLGLFSLSVVSLASVVSIGNVVANMPLTNAPALMSFLFHAFTDTTAMVQTLSLVAIGAAAWYASDFIKRRGTSPAFS